MKNERERESEPEDRRGSAIWNDEDFEEDYSPLNRKKTHESEVAREVHDRKDRRRRE